MIEDLNAQQEEIKQIISEIEQIKFPEETKKKLRKEEKIGKYIFEIFEREDKKRVHLQKYGYESIQIETHLPAGKYYLNNGFVIFNGAVINDEVEFLRVFIQVFQETLTVRRQILDDVQSFMRRNKEAIKEVAT